MKHIFTPLFILIVFGINAQTYPWLGQFNGEIPYGKDLFDSSIAANKYSGMIRIYKTFTKKGKIKSRTETHAFKYDDKGFTISYEVADSRNKKTEKYNYSIKDSLLNGYTYFKNNKLKRTYEIRRNNMKYITDILKTDSKNKLVLKQHHDFNTDWNVSKTAIYGKNDKEFKAIEYTYYDKKTLKQAKEYKKGKLKKVWNYTCDPAGTNEKKAKEIKVCKNVNVDENGNRVESNRIVNHKGEVELRVNTFDKNEVMIKQLVYDDLKHKLKSEYIITTVNGNEETVYRRFSKRGKELYSNKRISRGDKLLSNEYIFKQKKRHHYKMVFEYNDKNLLTRSEGYDGKNRKTWENIHTYN